MKTSSFLKASLFLVFLALAGSVMSCGTTYSYFEDKEDIVISTDAMKKAQKSSSEFEGRKPFKYTVAAQETMSADGFFGFLMQLAIQDVLLVVHIDSENGKYPVKYDLDCDGDGTYDYYGLTEDSFCVLKNGSGNHQIWLRGDIPGLQLCPTTLIRKDSLISHSNSAWVVDVRSVDDWGDIAWKTMHRFANRCFQLTTLPDTPPNLKDVSDMSEMFQNTNDFNYPINDWDVSSITNMSYMFAFSDFNQPLDTWDVSNVTNMNSMFREARRFDQSLNPWNVSNVKDMNDMFNGAWKLHHYPEDWVIPEGHSEDMFTGTPVSDLTNEKPLKTENRDE